MSEPACRISISSSPETETRDFATVLEAELAQATPPLLAWAEPDLTAVSLKNRTGRREGFRALASGKPDWSDDPPLVEARLFWRNSALHVVADDTRQGCRWVRIEQRDDGEKKVIRRVFPIQTLQDRQRFGLPGKGEELTAIEYMLDGRLIGWRLVTGEP